MARVGKNILTQGLQGKVGNVIYRTVGKTTSVYVMSERNVPLSEKQKEAQVKFAEAVRFAREALSKPAELEKFTRLAKSEGKASAYGAAISWFMTSTP